LQFLRNKAILRPEDRPQMTPDFMNAPAHYFHAGFILISVANLIVIVLMLLVFILAVVLPFPGGRRTE
jgi:hypothetical protein